MKSDFTNQHYNTSYYNCNSQIHDRSRSSSDDHRFPRLSIRNTLHALNPPDLTMNNPKPVHQNPIKPIHNHKKKIRLNISSFKIPNSIPDRNKQQI